MTLRAFVIDEVCPSTKISVIEAITANASRIPNGGALLRNIDVLLSKECGVPAIIAEEPLTCVARGGGEAIEMIDMHGGDIFSDEI